MSYHQTAASPFTSADIVARALSQLPDPIAFLPPSAEAFFAPVNTNRNWATSLVKRAMDLMVALPLAVMLAPLMALIAIAIRLDSKGPVLFRQTRNGICGRPFHILKFRTMAVMEDGDAVVQAREGDPRVTRLGALLRRYSLDELPQLFNVVAGDMSLVGPRPHAVAHDSYYAPLIADYRHRFAVKPGITGWAQIHGRRGPTPEVADMAGRIEHDVFYVRRAGLLLDLKILAATPLVLINPQNAV